MVKNKKSIFLILAVIIAVLLASFYSISKIDWQNQPYENNSTNPPTNSKEVYCTDESRNAEACLEIYSPVCGWSDPEKIQCFTYPCAQTFSNSCFACIDENVLYYTEGECPKTGTPENEVFVCADPRPEACTKEYSPVCGSDSNGNESTFGNGCMACLNKEIESWKKGTCE